MNHSLRLSDNFWRFWGGLIVLIGLTLMFTPLGHAERHIPQAEAGL